MSAVNSFHSHLVLAGASDRSVSIFDMNAVCAEREGNKESGRVSVCESERECV